MRHRFFGGVNPAAHKESTRRKPITRLENLPAEVILPLSLEGGQPAQPAVKVGDKVAVGQPVALGEAGGVCVHASISGTVKAIEDRPVPWGGTTPAVVIEGDGKDLRWEDRPAPLVAGEITLGLLLERVREAGIAGMGGGGFPTADKLSQAAGKIDTLVVNASECEPYLTADHRLLLERSDKIIQATQILARVLGAQRAVLITEGDKLNAAEVVEGLLRRRSGQVELRTVGTRYPLGAEKQIVQAVTGREVPPGGSPLDVKCAVLNVATVFAIHETLFRGRALTHRAVTVTGGAVSRPRNLWVPLGTPLHHLIEEAGGLREEPDLILTGGPMMGTPQSDLEAPVVKSTGGLLCLTALERRRPLAETVCVRCGKCLSVCPMHLAPAFIVQALRAGDEGRLEKLHPQDCLSCACCSYTCPARIPLAELVGEAKAQVKTKFQKGGAL